MSDLDNMFEDSDSEMLDPSGCVPTPPASVQPHITAEIEEGFTSLKAVKREPPSNLRMFPTPPSHVHPSLHRCSLHLVLCSLLSALCHSGFGPK